MHPKVMEEMASLTTEDGQAFDPARMREYIKPLTAEEINALTPAEAQARMFLLKAIQSKSMSPKEMKRHKRSQKFSAKLAQRLRGK